MLITKIYASYYANNKAQTIEQKFQRLFYQDTMININ